MVVGGINICDMAIAVGTSSKLLIRAVFKSAPFHIGNSGLEKLKIMSLLMMSFFLYSVVCTIRVSSKKGLFSDRKHFTHNFFFNFYPQLKIFKYHPLISNTP